MGSRARRFGPGSSGRARLGIREGSPRGRREEPPHFRGRGEYFESRREREEPPEFRSRGRSPGSRFEESARDRIRRENEEHERSRERSRSFHRRPSVGHNRDSRERHSSRGHVSHSMERRGRSRERKNRSVERRGHSASLRFEPPDNGSSKAGFDRGHGSSSRQARYSPPHEDIQFVEDAPIPNRFSPPIQERFAEMQYNKEEFEPRSSFNRDMMREMSEANKRSGIDGPVSKSQGFTSNQKFVSQQNLQQPIVGKQEYSQKMGISSDFPHKPAIDDQGFPTDQGQFSNNAFPGQGGIEGDNPDDPLIPEFNPETSKFSSIEWVKLIDEKARQYDWQKDEKQYIMASRLAGFARQWYLQSGVNCKAWRDLRQAFLNAFPTEMGYYSLLTKMLARVKEDSESMASYFHHKVALLNACEILGRKAVSCIISGLPAVKLRVHAITQNFEDPDELYLFLRAYDTEIAAKNISPEDYKKALPTTTKCFSCGLVGHKKFQCPKLKDKPPQQSPQNSEKDKVGHYNKVMHGSLSRKPTFPKYFTDVSINGVSLKAYVDQGSECTTIREENAKLLKLPVKKQYKIIRGFAGSSLSSIGFVDVPICVDRAIANILLFVVPDHLQAIPVIIGQSCIEQPHLVVMKDGDKIRFYQRLENGKTNFDF